MINRTSPYIEIFSFRFFLVLSLPTSPSLSQSECRFIFPRFNPRQHDTCPAVVVFRVHLKEERTSCYLSAVFGVGAGPEAIQLAVSSSVHTYFRGARSICCCHTTPLQIMHCPFEMCVGVQL